MEVTVEPVTQGVVLGVEIGVEVVHHLALVFYVFQQILVMHAPILQALMRGEFTERWRGVGDDGVDGAEFVYCVEPRLVEKRCFILPIQVGRQRVGRVRLMVVFGRHAQQSVDGCGTTYAKDGMSAGLHQGIVGQRHPALVLDGLYILGRAKRRGRAEVCWVVVIAANEQQPVVSLREFLDAFLIQVLVIARPLESKAAVTCHDNQRFRHAVLHATLKDQLRKVSVNVTAHYDALRLGEFVDIITFLKFRK